MLVYLREPFFNGDIRFLTFKGSQPKHQKIGFVNDRIRKISKTYVIVREQNKKSEGYHFHALIKCDISPKPSWFLKGVHMNLQKLGDKGFKAPLDQAGLPIKMKSEEVKDVPDGLTCDEFAKLQIVQNVIEKSMIKINRWNQDVVKVLTYMSKELEYPSQYTDYIICLSGKMQVIE